MARLRREASLGMRLAHPNICHIIRLGETEDGLVYVVMPFVEGRDLSPTARIGSAAFRSRRSCASCATSPTGLHVAHELKIVHRDLKPENIMVCAAADGSERARGDGLRARQGAARGAELQKLTATGIILGTPEFMSPEQLRGKPLDRAHRHLLAGADDVRDAHGQAAVRRTHAAGDDDRAAAQRSDAAAADAPRPRTSAMRWSVC